MVQILIKPSSAEQADFLLRVSPAVFQYEPTCPVNEELFEPTPPAAVSPASSPSFFMRERLFVFKDREATQTGGIHLRELILVVC
jgi:hypothetical protein